jgi:hypothetical protein
MRGDPRGFAPARHRRLALAIALALLGGCAAPLLRFEPGAPPAVLVPAALAGIEDLRGRYREVLCAVLSAEDPAAGGTGCDAPLHRMAEEPAPTGLPVHLGPPRLRLRVGIVPGYGADCLAGLVTVLGDAAAHLSARGWAVEALAVEGLSSSRRNAAAIGRALMEARLAPDERFVLVGYSKGASDMLEALAHHPETRPRVAAAVSLAGTVLGSPLADDPPRLLPGLLQAFSGSGCEEGDGGAFDSLRRNGRVAFLARFPPAGYGVPLYSLGAFAAAERTSLILRPMQRRLAFLDPRNDSQTLATDQVIPGSALLGHLDADHWAVALPLRQALPLLSAMAADGNDFPRGAVLEAVLRLIEERLIAGR